MQGSNSLAVYSEKSSAVDTVMGNPWARLNEANVEMARQLSEIIRNAIASPIAEIVREFQESQQEMAISMLRAIPLALRFEPFPAIQEAEIVNDIPVFGDIAMTIEGQFLFQGSLIHTVSAGSKHGRFLKMLLTFENNFVSDDEFRKQIDLSDEDKGIGYIRRDLKKYLGVARIEIDILRVRKYGHKLVSIRKMAN